MTKDRMTVAREALTKAAATFREYEAHHDARAKAADNPADASASREKAQRNHDMAVECDGAAALLTAQ